MTVTIRPAMPGDAATVLRFVKELAAYERAPDAVVATEAMMDEALFGARPAAEALIAEIAGKAVGFALFFHNFSTWTGRRGLWLEDVYVTPEARGTGVGGKLLRRLAQIARERDCARLEWWVLDWNAPAIDFYDSLEAETMDQWTVRRLSGATLGALAERA